MSKFYAMLGIGKKAGYILSGETACTQDIKRKKTSLLILAEDSSENTKNNFLKLCKKHNVKYIITGEKRKLGHAIGKDLTAMISIRNQSFSDAILNIIK